MKKILLAVLVGLVLTAQSCSQTARLTKEQSAKALTEEQLKSTFSDKKFRWSSARGTGTITYNADGTSNATSSRGSSPGKWAVKGNTMCVSFKFSNWKEQCETVVPVGDDKYKLYRSDGSWSADLSAT